MSDPTAIERRVQQLEELVAHQQHLLEQLNEVIVELRGDFESLNRRFVHRFLELESQLARHASDAPAEKPPHY